MLKLIYFKCEALRGFDNPEFVFSSKYSIEYKKPYLNIHKIDDCYIDDFYGKNIEINANVGNNGSGKSSLLKRLYSALQKNDPINTDSFILVFEKMENNNTTLFVISTGEQNRIYKTKK